LSELEISASTLSGDTSSPLADMLPELASELEDRLNLLSPCSAIFRCSIILLMALEYKAWRDVSEEDKEKYRELVRHYSRRLKQLPSETLRSIPFIGENIYRYQLAHFLEASFFFQKTNDPVIDQKMLNAFMIRDYELNFHCTTGLIWSALFYALPAWRGFARSTRITISLLPFAVAAYRGFRRGYDQITYVGETYMEHHCKKAALLRHFRDHDDFLPEFKQFLLKETDFNSMLRVYGIPTLELPSAETQQQAA
jgi:hypothetical protein